MKKVTLTIKVDILHESNKPTTLDLAKISGSAVKALSDSAKVKGFTIDNLFMTDK